MDLLLLLTDQTLRANGLQDEVTGDYLNSATVTATITNKLDEEVAGVTWPITLSYVTASNGNYRGNIPHDAEFVEGKTYLIEVTAVSGSFQRVWKFPRVAEYGQP